MWGRRLLLSRNSLVKRSPIKRLFFYLRTRTTPQWHLPLPSHRDFSHSRNPSFPRYFSTEQKMPPVESVEAELSSMERYLKRTWNLLWNGHIDEAVDLFAEEIKRLEGKESLSELFHPFLHFYAVNENLKELLAVFRLMDAKGYDPLKESTLYINKYLSSQMNIGAAFIIKTLSSKGVDTSKLYGETIRSLLESHREKEADQLIIAVGKTPPVDVCIRVAQKLGRLSEPDFQTLFKILTSIKLGSIKESIIWMALRECKTRGDFLTIRFIANFLLDSPSLEDFSISVEMYEFLFEACNHAQSTLLVRKLREHIINSNVKITLPTILTAINALETSEVLEFMQDLKKKNVIIDERVLIAAIHKAGVNYDLELLEELAKDIPNYPISIPLFSAAFEAFFQCSQIGIATQYLLTLDEEGFAWPSNVASFFAGRFPGTFNEFLPYQRTEGKKRDLRPDEQSKMRFILKQIVDVPKSQ